MVIKPIVFLLDDSRATLSQGEALLQNNYDVYTSSSADAFFLLLERVFPDVILLDVLMPGMDGFDVITKLKADPRYRDIPVMFLTGKSDSESERRGFALGAADYITKPFSGPLLQKRIETQLIQRQLESVVNSNAVSKGIAQVLEDVIERLQQLKASVPCMGESDLIR